MAEPTAPAKPNAFLIFLTGLRDKLLSLVTKFIDLIGAMLDGIRSLVSTPKGIVVGLIALGLLFDVLSLGKAGFITFSVDTVRQLLEVIVSIVKEGGWQIVTLVAILILFKRTK